MSGKLRSSIDLPGPVTGQTNQRTGVSTSRRADWDHARAIGIFLVVYGHALDRPPLLPLIYAFHMPLFFVLAGMMSKPSTFAVSVPEFARRTSRSLLIPYVCFSIISLVIWIVLRPLRPATRADASWSVVDALSRLIYGAGSELGLINGTLWFFTALFVVMWLAYLLAKVLPARLQWVASLVALLAMLYSPRPWPSPLPWNLDVAVVALGFFMLGTALRNVRWDQLRWRSSPTAAIGFVVSVLLLAACASYNQRVDLREFVVGNPALFLGGAVGGTFATLLIAGALPAAWISQRLSQDSIVIFPLHLPLLVVVSAVIAKGTGLSRELLRSELGAALISILVIALLLPVAHLIRRWAPWMIGGR